MHTRTNLCPICLRSSLRCQYLHLSPYIDILFTRLQASVRARTLLFDPCFRAFSPLRSNIRGRCSPIAFHLRIMYSTCCLGNAHESPALVAISYWCNPSTRCGVQEAFSFAVADTTKQLRVVELSRSRLQTMRVCTKLFAR